MIWMKMKENDELSDNGQWKRCEDQSFLIRSFVYM